MEIFKKQVDRFYINEKKFVTEEQAQDYMDKQIRVHDLKKLIKPYMKNAYMNLDDALEDIFIGMLDSKDQVIDVIERPF